MLYLDFLVLDRLIMEVMFDSVFSYEEDCSR